MRNPEDIEDMESYLDGVVVSMKDVPEDPTRQQRIVDGVMVGIQSEEFGEESRWPLSQYDLAASSYGAYNGRLRRGRKAAGLSPDRPGSITPEEMDEAKIKHGITSGDSKTGRGVKPRKRH